MNIFKQIKQFFAPKLKEVGNWKTWNITGRETQNPNYIKEYKSWTFANIKVLAQIISSIDMKLMKVIGEDVKEITEHPFLDLLYRPNPFMTKSDLMKLITTYLLMWGEAPIRLKRKNPLNPKETPSELWLTKPSDTVVKVGKTPDKFQLVTGYEINIDGEQQELKPWEMVFINNCNPENIFRGIGVIEASASTIDSMNYAEDYNLNFFKNSAIPSAVLYTEQGLNDNEWNRLNNIIQSGHGSVVNAHKTMILERGLKIEKIQSTAKDMDFIEQQKYMRDKLISMFGNTKAILGITEDVNRANAEASEYIVSKYTVKPIMSQIVDYLNEFLLPVFDPTGTLFLTFDDPTPEDRTLRLNEYTQGINKWLTPNEIRNELGLEPLEGGDIIYQSFGLVPMGTTQDPQAVKMIASKPKNSAKKYKEEIKRLENRNLRRKNLVIELRKMLKKIVKNTPTFKGKKYKSARDKTSLEFFIKNILTKATNFDKALKEKANIYYREQEKEIKYNLINSKGVSDYMFDKSKSVKTGINLMTPVIEALILSQGEEAFELLGIQRPYSLLTEAMKYLKQQPTKFVKSMTDTAYEKVRNSLAEGIKSGESTNELSKRVSGVYSELTKSQSNTVARTEVTRATNFAQLDAYKQSGVVYGKEWVATEDDRECEFCSAMETMYNSKNKLDDNYFKKGDTMTGTDGGILKLDYSDIDAPPLHVNCRCVTIPVIEPIKSASSEEEEELDTILKDLESEQK